MIRDFTKADQAATEALIVGGLRERWGESYDDSFNLDLADIEANYVANGAQVIVVESDHQIVATGALLPEGNGARIVRMSVAPSHRRTGLGRNVVAELVERARAAGCVEILVSTEKNWHSALTLYRACGFQPTGQDEIDNHFTMAL